ncbi:hypothetical protein [Clostridium thermobutyricum]|uniref:Phage shock protein B n=1 Tax=Clostridium thermobutyricum DSM 4928 TaxID=1121339 RepID=A0A1V4SQ42_9CLOT|nr:hypothetical protein [Clostridium thermobutyricum]OPX45586.1 hypothetical protein CLTHE_30140 [Clostridium thermobutyricum DSM 4928]
MSNVLIGWFPTIFSFIVLIISIFSLYQTVKHGKKVEKHKKELEHELIEWKINFNKRKEEELKLIKNIFNNYDISEQIFNEYETEEN